MGLVSGCPLLVYGDERRYLIAWLVARLLLLRDFDGVSFFFQLPAE